MSWFRSSSKPVQTMNAAEEDAHLQSVERALLELLNDDIAAADKILKENDSSYHHLGRGISNFIASMLGAEKELIKEAAAALLIAEAKTWDDMKKAQREPTAYRSHIYAPGTEYLLCYAISQLTSAITAVLSGSVTEAIKGFYKLRKAYLTLDSIMAVEKTYFERRVGSREGHVPPTLADLSTIPEDEVQGSRPTSASNGSAVRQSAEVLSEKSFELVGSPRRASHDSLAPRRTQSNVLEQDPAELGITSHTDIFIHSGTRLCYGMLLVVFSMIENPVFNKILYIVGFKGDRERGTRYLWEAARFGNFNGAIAGISLLGYYNGLVGVCDILPSDPGANDDLAGYPKARCEALLADMSKRYPESKLWKLERARMLGYNRQLPEAVKILQQSGGSNMKQIAGIVMFETSLTSMCAHEYQLCADSWIKYAGHSTWSPTLSSYMTGCAYLELFRNLKDTNPEEAKVFKDKATEFIRKGPPLAGRQKVMNRELPFDVFIVRKVKKWEERAKLWGVDLADAIGTSPLAEQMYLWNGVKKQNTEELNQGLRILDWERTTHPEKHKANLDEVAAQALLRSSILRNMKQYTEAKDLLKTEILSHDRNEFKGPGKDDWTCPSAHYEMAALAWVEKDLEGQDHKAKVRECEEWLHKCQKWPEAYTLDTRMSFKLTTSQITLKRHKRIMGL